MIAIVFFAVSVTALVLTINALRRPVPPGKPFPPPWLAGMVVSELAPVIAPILGLVAAGFFATGGAQTRIGTVGLVLAAISLVGLIVLMARTLSAAAATGTAYSAVSLFRVSERPPPEVEVSHNLRYADGLTLDRYARPGAVRAPTLVYLHPAPGCEAGLANTPGPC